MSKWRFVQGLVSQCGQKKICTPDIAGPKNTRRLTCSLGSPVHRRSSSIPKSPQLDKLNEVRSETTTSSQPHDRSRTASKMLPQTAARARIASSAVVRRAFHTSRPQLSSPYHYPEGPRSNLPFNPLTKWFAIRYWGFMGKKAAH